jgi:hypothetical protein
MTLKQAAWRGQADIVNSAWSEYQNREEYPNALVLKPGARNISKRARHPFGWIALAVIVLAVLCLFS